MPLRIGPISPLNTIPPCLTKTKPLPHRKTKTS